MEKVTIQSIQYMYTHTFVQTKREGNRERGRKNVNPNKMSLRGLSGKHNHGSTLAGDWWRNRRK